MSSSIGSSSLDDAVSAQYLALPYPERRPADEDRRLVVGSPSHWREIDHYLFGGRRDWTRPFRALIAGGGTGDAAIMLAQQLADIGCPAELVHLDPSPAARQVAEARAARRGLSLAFVTGRIEALPELGLGRFDYIDCCGVLHHLADPPAALATLVQALAPGGGLGLMVYGRHGRSGVYEMQALLRAVAGGGTGAPKERVAIGRRLLAELPASNLLRRNPQIQDHVDGGDAGFFDLLLHPRDRAYDVPELARLIAGAGLAIAAFIEPMRYDPATYVRHPELRRRFAALDPVARAAAAELIACAMTRHVVYAAPEARPAAEPADDAIPVWRAGTADAMAKAIGPNGVLEARDGLLDLRLAMPPQAALVAGLADGRRTWAELVTAVAERSRKPEAAAATLVDGVYRSLSAANLLLLSRTPTAQ